MNPTSDLGHTYHPNIQALIELVGDRYAPTTDTRASRENLVASLRRFSPGSDGVFFYSGHAGTLDFSGSLNAALKLCDDEFFTAGELMGVVGSGDATPSPSRVILSACDSSGASGTGAGEWMGLATAFLVSGAQQVIATAWSVYDSSFGGGFEERLVDLVREIDDAAYALTLVQRRALLMWRNHTPVIPETQAAYPVIWAAYQCLGVKPLTAES
jgi:hypothetical protein